MLQKLGQIVAHNEKPKKETEIEEFETSEDVMINNSLNDECPIETIPNQRWKAYDNIATPAETSKTSSLMEFREKPSVNGKIKSTSATDSTEVAAAPLPPLEFKPPKEEKEPPKEQKETPKGPKEMKQPKTQTSNNKGWRPTLMPIPQENVANIAREPLKTAVHSLPSLVQVISSGNRYHISFEVYNKLEEVH
ncbi:unnamed protein product [Pieris brassicae]|uniref:Uncharacterized protein n=1 Tax=Pieris brassicae TaxID=7116 RepID=A0A9P0XEZ6_PIEBR|nr:unnamed protein product [Pieris brassicae]